MSVSKGMLSKLLFEQTIWLEIENDETYKKLGLERSSLKFVEVDQKFLDNLPDLVPVVNVELRSIGQGSWNVWLVREDGGSQLYHSTLAGSVHK
jgi:hypothetical protein